MYCKCGRLYPSQLCESGGWCDDKVLHVHVWTHKLCEATSVAATAYLLGRVARQLRSPACREGVPRRARLDGFGV